MCWEELGRLLSLLNSGRLESAWISGICLPIYAKHRSKNVLPWDEMPRSVCVLVGGGGKAPLKPLQVFPAKLSRERSSGLSPHPKAFSGPCREVTPARAPCPALPCPWGPSAAQGAAFIWAQAREIYGRGSFDVGPLISIRSISVS